MGLEKVYNGNGLIVYLERLYGWKGEFLGYHSSRITDEDKEILRLVHTNI